MTQKPDIYFIGGPTAAGKTAKALELAAEYEGIVINADAMQVYSSLPLLTAQPTSGEKASAPHKLFEVFDPSEKSSVGRWMRLARVEIRSALAMGRRPIVVGGTGMYFGALLGKLADIPDIPDHVRVEATELYEKEGHDAFRSRLSGKDPESATQIEQNDKQRLIRAFEVAEYTGKTLGEWQREGESSSLENEYSVHKILIMPDRDLLYARIDKRFLQMVDRGALEEVQALKDRSLDPTLPSMKILGVPELMGHLQGDYTLYEAIEKAQQATRNFAKRQMTWFRNQWKDVSEA